MTVGGGGFRLLGRPHLDASFYIMLCPKGHNMLNAECVTRCDVWEEEVKKSGKVRTLFIDGPNHIYSTKLKILNIFATIYFHLIEDFCFIKLHKSMRPLKC